MEFELRKANDTIKALRANLTKSAGIYVKFNLKVIYLLAALICYSNGAIILIKYVVADHLKQLYTFWYFFVDIFFFNFRLSFQN